MTIRGKRQQRTVVFRESDSLKEHGNVVTLDSGGRVKAHKSAANSVKCRKSDAGRKPKFEDIPIVNRAMEIAENQSPPFSHTPNATRQALREARPDKYKDGQDPKFGDDPDFKRINTKVRCALKEKRLID